MNAIYFHEQVRIHSNNSNNDNHKIQTDKDEVQIVNRHIHALGYEIR